MTFAIKKLEKLEDQSSSHDTFTFTKVNDTLSLRLVIAAKASKYALPDDKLSWRQMDIGPHSYSKGTVETEPVDVPHDFLDSSHRIMSWLLSLVLLAQRKTASDLKITICPRIPP